MVRPDCAFKQVCEPVNADRPGRAAAERLGGRQFPRSSDCPYAAGAGGERHGRQRAGPNVPGHGRQFRAGVRRLAGAASARQRHRELHQGCPKICSQDSSFVRSARPRSSPSRHVGDRDSEDAIGDARSGSGAMIMDLLERLRSTNVLASISAFSAAWMVMMATRYFSLSAGDINGGIGIGSDDGSWLPTAYSICEPIGVVLGCWLAAGLAVRQVMLASVALVTFASLLPVGAPGLPALILSRASQGLSSGAILPLSFLSQLRAFGPGRRALAIALYASSTTMGPQAAGLIDAWIVACFGWTAVFWVSVVPGIVSLATGFAGFWKDSFRWRPLIDADLAGLLTLATALGLLACGLSQSDRLRWLQSPATMISFAAARLSFVLFFAHEWHGIPHPVVSVRLTRRWNLALGIICTLPLQFATVFSGAIVPNALTDLQGYRPEQIAPSLTAALWPQCLSYATCGAVLHFSPI